MAELCFGFVPQGVLADLVDVGNWKVRWLDGSATAGPGPAGFWQQFACTAWSLGH
jgi:hypothetical protein